MRVGILGSQAGALGEQLIAPVGTCHTYNLNDVARSVVDHRALRARPP